MRIPFMPPLSPATFFSSNGENARPFPFSFERVQYYYLARNAIWHGVDSLGLKPGDEVLMPAYCHGVEVEALLRKGLRLTYYRIDEGMEIDFKHMESLLSQSTRVLYIIHYLGFPQPIDKLKAFAKKHGLILFEDCALSLFSCLPSGPLGSFGDISIFCFYKTLPVPHGGAIVLNNPTFSLPAPPHTPNSVSTMSYLSDRLLEYLDLRWDGYERLVSNVRNTVKNIGRTIKCGIHAATAVPIDTDQFDENHVNLGIAGITDYLIKKIDHHDVIQRRRKNFAYLAGSIEGVIRMPFRNIPEGVCPLSLPVLVHDKPGIQHRLMEHGVETVNFWSKRPPDIPDIFPEVAFLRRHVLEVPIHQGLEERHLDYIASKLRVHAG